MNVADLLDESAEAALTHAAALHQRLCDAQEAGEADLGQCCDEMRQLLSDIATLRQAAMLLTEPTRS